MHDDWKNISGLRYGSLQMFLDNYVCACADVLKFPNDPTFAYICRKIIRIHIVL